MKKSSSNLRDYIEALITSADEHFKDSYGPNYCENNPELVVHALIKLCNDSSKDIKRN